jgi:hypothetical protein
MVSALSRNVTHVRAEEFSDCRSYGAPEVLHDLMLFGKTPEEAAKSPMLAVMGGGFLQSIDMVADALGFALDEKKISKHEVSVATKPIDSPIGPIQPGHVAAQRFTWQATVRGEPVMTVRTNWFMGEENLEPAWTFGPEGQRFEVEVTGRSDRARHVPRLAPRVDPGGARAQPGIVATAIHGISAIPYVCRAPAGIQTYLDLPLVAGRACSGASRSDPRPFQAHRSRRDRHRARARGSGAASRSRSPRRAPTSCAPRARPPTSRAPRRRSRSAAGARSRCRPTC